jgi:hypothetical protein
MRRRKARLDFTQKTAINLLAGGITPATQARYGCAIMGLEAFLRFYGGPSLLDLMGAGAWQAMTVWIILYLQISFETDLITLSGAGNLLSGLRRKILQALQTHALPDLVIQMLLKPLWAAFGTWKRLEPYEFRTPVPYDVAVALMAAATMVSRKDFCLFIALGFFALLRPGEILALEVRDFWFDRLKQKLVISIRNPKIKRGGCQHVVVEDHWLVTLLYDYMVVLPPCHRLFPWTEWQLLKMWRALLRVIRVSVSSHDPTTLLSRWTPAGLRSGGATYHYITYQSLDKLMWKGRWAQMSTLHHYIQLGVYHYTVQKLPVQAEARLHFYTHSARTLFGVP